MFKHLKKLFSTIILKEDCNLKQVHLYQWYEAKDEIVFGIKKTELTDRDQIMLKAFTQPYNISIPTPTVSENNWWNRVNNINAETLSNDITPYRFVYFIMSKKQADPVAFKEGLHVMFDREIPILWTQSNEGILVEEVKETAEQISYNQIIDTLSSDFYINIKFLTGPFLSEAGAAAPYFQQLITIAKTAFTVTDKNVLSYMESMLFSIMSNTDVNLQAIGDITLQNYANDQEFLDTITVFLQCNLNVSEAAKQLFMHRNSLQYRLDKFKQGTGLDVRDFHQAVNVYLAVLFKRTK